MPHVALLGDSIFDNRSYVGAGPDVIAQLRQALGAGWAATLLARDGDRIGGVPQQLRRLPADVTHLVVSVGGNDALGYSGVLNLGTPTIAEALLRLASVSAEFEDSYAAMLDGLSATGLRLAVCTIYDPAYPDAVRQRAAATALKVLNDPILRLAAERGLPVIELRLVCRSPEDYANPIEPSVQGGRRIAAAIAGLLRHHAFETGRSTIYL